MVTKGDKAPDFTLKDCDGGTFTLSKAIEEAKAFVVIYFYPNANTFGCLKESCSFRDNHDKFLSQGATVIGISKNDATKNKKMKDDNNLPFLLLCDETLEVHKLYGIGSLSNSRQTFCINKEGVVTFVYNNVMLFFNHTSKVLNAIADTK
ncbi:peroxiredoxin [Acrasis kona]|uniref:thioredoxin-dependent peroxiredoxin n=1 Tax=Acrasis kona TaxID=1008807 RepID=A0AAW2ZAK3_9EUKA